MLTAFYSELASALCSLSMRISLACLDVSLLLYFPSGEACVLSTLISPLISFTNYTLYLFLLSQLSQQVLLSTNSLASKKRFPRLDAIPANLTVRPLHSTQAPNRSNRAVLFACPQGPPLYFVSVTLTPQTHLFLVKFSFQLWPALLVTSLTTDVKKIMLLPKRNRG